MRTTEEWRVIPSLPTHEASSLGRIRCIPFFSKTANRWYGGKEWFGVWEPVQERYVIIYKGKTYRLARLVCEAFHGPCPKGFVCMHKDENSRNNHKDNLKWATQKENLNCPNFITYCKGRVGDKSPTTKHRKRLRNA